ncbi:MAG TPA: hypothetical protein VHC40_11470 [Rhizomicrobium sp.]|nr:hypothetical protein [Rhizomicrobium sp.]
MAHRDPHTDAQVPAAVWTGGTLMPLALVLALCAAPATPQPMPAMDMNDAGMGGMKMDDMPGMHGKKAPPPKKAKPQHSTPAPHTDAMPGMDHAMPDHDMGHGLPDHDMPGHDMQGQAAMPDMPHDMAHDMAHGMAMHGFLGGYAMSREASGTSWQPDAAPHDGIALMLGDWMAMVHGRVYGVLDSQSGPRGGSSVFSSSMVMAMASRDLANGDTLGLKAMISGDPFMGRRGYPLLLASGETADGATHLVDRQHPHDLFMELAASYSHPLSAGDSIFLYVGYPGEPALGPSAYMHRVSAADNPMTPIAHHWLDSTHVTFGVATAGIVHDGWKLEVSQFTGREPDQNRFDFDSARFDSTSARLSFNPDSNWSLQASIGWLKSPEQLEPGVNERRFTASATYYNAFEFGSIAATLAFGNKHLSDGADENAGLIEAEYRPVPLWTLFTRAEIAGNGELVPGPGVKNTGEFSAGVIRDWRLADHMKFGVGGLYAFDFPPGSAAASYGAAPHGAMAFVRLVAD